MTKSLTLHCAGYRLYLAWSLTRRTAVRSVPPPPAADRMDALLEATAQGTRDLDEIQRWIYGDDPPTRGNGTYRGEIRR